MNWERHFRLLSHFISIIIVTIIIIIMNEYYIIKF